MQTTKAYLELIQKRGKQGLPLERVYRQLFNRELYLTAYGKIYRNAGAMTKGVSGETADGMSLEKIDAIIGAMRTERYRWRPARRVYIEKKHSTKKRPLGIPVWSDKLVQEAIRSILEAYYEPQWSRHSHGFRPNRGCHTALREIYYNWTGTTWFIEGDISACFDRLDHDLLLSALAEKIHDGRFITLMGNLLKAGYLEEWKFNQTLSGTPQGGVISPILANILLDKLDRFVETVLIPQYTRGGRRRANSAYRTLMQRARREHKRGHLRLAQTLRRQAQHLPSFDPRDPTYRRLRYVRYADDFLLGFIGPKSEAEAIKQQVAEFLREELKLELSATKTLITHARSEAARFLGYEITTIQQNAKRVTRLAYGRRAKCRSVNGRVGLRVPKDVMEKKSAGYRKPDDPDTVLHKPELLAETDYSIVTTYQLEFRGIANYYRLAYNLHTLNKLKWVMEQSLTKTLAAKHRQSVRQIYQRFGAQIVVGGKPYKGLQVTVQREGKRPLVATWGGVPLNWDMEASIDDHPPRVWRARTELEKRLLAQVCEHCGSREHLRVHHIRALKDLNTPGRKKSSADKWMATRHRKTMVLCQECHEDVHAGRPMRHPARSLLEAQA